MSTPLYGGRVSALQTNTRAGNKLFLESDLVLGIGSVCAERRTGDLTVYRGERKFIHVDIEPTVIGKVISLISPSWRTPSWPWRP